jgi:glycosyltransferase involved in cell wall biosynthesis
MDLATSNNPSPHLSPGGQPIELSILMPCLNEAETLEACIRQALSAIDKSGVTGEVVIADNGSTDGSRDIALRAGARVVDVPIRGYGAALWAGVNAARGTYVLMGDADGSYDFSSAPAFLEKLRGGKDLVMGNRFKGGIRPGAMPLSHRMLGNPVLTAIGRMFFGSACGDFHCGLRGFQRQQILALGLRAKGMEFASELIVRSVLAAHTIVEVPTELRRDGRSGRSHLRTWRDGARHLWLLLAHSPGPLAGYAGAALLMVSLGAAMLTAWRHNLH